MNGIRKTVQNLQIDAIVQGYPTMFQVHFTPRTEFRNYRDAVTSDYEKYMIFRNRLLEQGVFLRPMHWGEIYVSAVHTDEDIDTTLAAMEGVLTEMKREHIL
jgi:glutamate-1-semialdehyde 2,1-aminomutase